MVKILQMLFKCFSARFKLLHFNSIKHIRLPIYMYEVRHQPNTVADVRHLY